MWYLFLCVLFCQTILSEYICDIGIKSMICKNVETKMYKKLNYSEYEKSFYVKQESYPDGFVYDVYKTTKKTLLLPIKKFST